jgi:Carboxypeptidase regulatory-like domain
MNSGSRGALHGIVVVLMAAGLSQSATAQIVRGAVSDSATRQPISGAVVMLLDSAGTALGREITGETGEYRIAYPRRARSIRVVRVGFQPRELSLADRGEPERPLDITMVPFSTTLATVRVTDKSNCPRRADGAAAFAFWDQARAGLLNTVVARKANPMSVHRLYFSRALSAETGRISSFVVSEDFSESAKTSFTSLRSASDLVRRGFAGDTSVVGFMFAPDADVLLDDAFSGGYCFRVAEPDRARPDRVGVAFSPADFRKGRVDIEGIVWIDTAARALLDVEFRYVGMQQIAEQFHPGGTISFATAANGVTFIDRWSLHLIGNAPYPVFSPSCRAGCGMHDSFYPTENGAEVSHVVWRDGLRWDGQLGTVSIHSTTAAGQPARGTMVQLADTHYRGTADSNGALRIPDLLPGPYALRVSDPRLNGLGISLPTAVRFIATRDSVVQLSLDVPTVEDFVVGECRKNRQWKTTDSTYLLGRVVDADKTPVADARVSFAVRNSNGGWDWEKEALKTGVDGVFESCGTTLAPGSKVQVRVESDRRKTREVTHEITGKMTIVPPIRIDARP